MVKLKKCQIVVVDMDPMIMTKRQKDKKTNRQKGKKENILIHFKMDYYRTK